VAHGRSCSITIYTFVGLPVPVPVSYP